MKRTTYAEEHGVWVYDWPAILHNIRHGLFTKKEMWEWRAAVDSWVTCACGNQCAAIPRYEGRGIGARGAPLDDQLYDFGTKFCDHIWQATAASTTSERATHCYAARVTLAAIEKRAAELLKEMGR